MILVLSPHNDDETLFAAFTILKYRAHVIVCHGSSGDYGSSQDRMHESAQAVAMLGGSLEQWDVTSGDGNLLHSKLFNGKGRDEYTRVFAPDKHASHPDHRLLAEVASDVFRGRLTTYHTYVDGKRVTPLSVGYGRPALLEHPSWIHRKLVALTSYRSQATHPRASQFFLDAQHEYYGADL